MYWQTKQSKLCKYCKKEYKRNVKFSVLQWNLSNYCSNQCSGKNKMKNDDGYKNRGERYRRKNGMLKQGTVEFREKISALTSIAMYKPDVQLKIKKKRKPMSDEHKGKISDRLKGKMPQNTIHKGRFSNVKSGWFKINGKRMFFRSRWEVNYALYLDFLKKQNQIEDWEYEADVFIFEKIKFGTRSYRPDFKIYNLDKSIEYHEIKGWMDPQSKTKLKRMAKYYPEIKLVIVDGKPYNDIKNKLGRIIGFID